MGPAWYENLFKKETKEVPQTKDFTEKQESALDKIMAPRQARVVSSTPSFIAPSQPTSAPTTKKKPKPERPRATPPMAPAMEQAAPQQADSKGFLSSLFSGGSQTKPGEYSTAREVGYGAMQFLGNLGNNLTGNFAGNRFLNDAFAQKRQEYADRDPNSNSSLLTRGIAKQLGMPIKGDESAYDLRAQMPYVRDLMASRAMNARGGGVDAPAQPKNNQQAIQNINDHIAAVRDLSAMRKNISSLNRNPLGSLLPDTNADTIATAAEIQKQAQAGVKAIAGPGSIQESEREAFMPLLPNANERSGVALAKQEKAMQTAIQKGKNYIKDQLMLGNINEDTARYLMSEYAKNEAELEAFGKKK